MRIIVLAVGAAAVLASGCAPLKSRQGYVVDADLMNSIQPGVDNRQSVQQTLGTPSFGGQFGEGDWYYLSRESRNYAFNSPKVKEQLTVRISFDPNGTVSAIRKSGVEQTASIDPFGKTTPTLGRKRGFFQDLFGNIGTVGSGMGGGAQQPTNTGGGRTTP